MKPVERAVDVLCVGYACYDLTFSVSHHLGADEKTRATALVSCGGGLAANGAVAAARLGHQVAFATYLGRDLYGEEHLRELQEAGVDGSLIARGDAPTPLSVVLVKPDGLRTLVNYQGDLPQLPADALDLDVIQPGAILVDGHQIELAQSLVLAARRRGIPTVLDGDSVHPGTEALMVSVEHLVASERFAHTFSGSSQIDEALAVLASRAPTVVVTQGEAGLVWQRGAEKGRQAAFPVNAVDTTGAGDAFHGAYVAGLSAGMAWTDLLRYASAVGALCCTKVGARYGIPTQAEVQAFLGRQP